jgi:uncharacterized protein (TIGR02145 family)
MNNLYSVRCVKDGKCGSQIINTSTQFCDNDTPHDLCGGKKYDPANQRCTNKVIETKCGTEWDVANDNQRCENGVWEIKCGTEWSSYDPKTQFCSDGTIEPYGKLTDDRDNKTYKTVKIGEQVWMAENLNYDVPNNDTDVCYDKDPNNCNIYGRLYNWETAMNGEASSSTNPIYVRGICPSGSHLPSNGEWAVLKNFVGTDAGLKLKANSSLFTTSTDKGTDNYGFSALPGGNGFPSGNFSNAGSYGYWWSTTEYGTGNNYARCRSMGGGIYRNNVNDCGTSKSELYSVRCLQN